MIAVINNDPDGAVKPRNGPPVNSDSGMGSEAWLHEGYSFPVPAQITVAAAKWQGFAVGICAIRAHGLCRATRIISFP